MTQRRLLGRCAVMASTNRLRVPDFINPRGTALLLESTGITLDPESHQFLEELEHLSADLDPATAAEQFLGPQHDRLQHRWAVFVAAHLYDGDAPDTLARPPWTIPTGTKGRPLTRVEQAMCRVTVNRWDTRSSVSPGQYALAEASAATGELIRLPIDAVSITGKARVRLGGGRDQLPRDVALDPWGTTALIRRLEAINGRDRTAPLVYDGTDPGTAKAQASASGNMKRVLRIAGLSDDPTLTPTSIRNTCAQRMHEGGVRIEDIAATMGTTSLDKIWQTLTPPQT